MISCKINSAMFWKSLFGLFKRDLLSCLRYLNEMFCLSTFCSITMASKNLQYSCSGGEDSDRPYEAPRKVIRTKVTETWEKADTSESYHNFSDDDSRFETPVLL